MSFLRAGTGFQASKPNAGTLSFFTSPCCNPAPDSVVAANEIEMENNWPINGCGHLHELCVCCWAAAYVAKRVIIYPFFAAKQIEILVIRHRRFEQKLGFIFWTSRVERADDDSPGIQQHSFALECDTKHFTGKILFSTWHFQKHEEMDGTRKMPFICINDSVHINSGWYMNAFCLVARKRRETTNAFGINIRTRPRRHMHIFTRTRRQTIDATAEQSDK